MGELREFPVSNKNNRAHHPESPKSADVFDFKKYVDDKKNKENADAFLQIFENDRTDFLRYDRNEKESVAIFNDFWMNQEFGLNKSDCENILAAASKHSDTNLCNRMEKILKNWPEK